MKIKGFEDTINWYSKNAQNYAASVADRYNEEHLEEFFKLLFKGAKVLDAGCAAGRDTALLAKRGLEMTGFDICDELLNVGRKNNKDIKFVQGTFLNLPFEDNQFDGIWARNCLLHLDSVSEVKKSLNEFSRVLKENGIIHIQVIAQTGAHETEIVKDQGTNHDRFFRYYKIGELKDWMEEVGFKIIKSFQYPERSKKSVPRELIFILASKSEYHA